MTSIATIRNQLWNKTYHKFVASRFVKKKYDKKKTILQPEVIVMKNLNGDSKMNTTAALINQSRSAPN